MGGVVEDTFGDVLQIPGKIVKGVIKPFMPQTPEVPQAPGAPASPKPDPEGRSPEIKAAVDQARKRLRAARGRQSTILTQNSTLGEASTRRKTILGS